jgi:sugar phosphate isomerase/epimerase
MTRFRLAVNAGFAVNRFPEPEAWLGIVGGRLGVRYAQFVADLLNPFLPAAVIEAQVGKIRAAAERFGVTIDSAFTSAFTRVNHVLHPDPQVREAWVRWYEDLLRLAARLGARGAGGHFGILSVRDFEDPARRERMMAEGIRNWQRLAGLARDLGMQFLMIEPMSVPREPPATIRDTHNLLARLNDGAAVPIRVCLDVDHGDPRSPDLRDTDPYAWLREFGAVSPVVHIKQSKPDKGGHWPFTDEHNREGIIQGEKVLDALRASGAEEVALALEVSHRERYPWEDRVLDDLKASVEYWRRYVAE